ncbi:alpha/beta hydrolase [Nocardia nova]|uniref:alpha/beta hydrolase n=1 Tax=Nocardia nova TaxID=37330 RepID=UPI0033D6FEE4
MSQPVHRFTAGTDPAAPPLVLLHGTYGSEFDLMPLADELSPGAAKLGIRGTVEIGVGYAFFRRFPDRRVDEADLSARVPVLAEFIETFGAGNHFIRRPMVVGFSNGAIMAAALLMTRPDLFAGAILFRSLSPFTDDSTRSLDGMPVLIVDGAGDDRRSPGDGALLAERLRDAGASVQRRLLPTGHTITADDVSIASEWLRARGY